jgi:tetrahydromethanopterin S-methyltransferase subunit A
MKTTLNWKLKNDAGRICEVLIPIKTGYFIGEGKCIAICTLSSMGLLRSFANIDDILGRILIVGRLLSENKGIDTLIQFTLTQPGLRHLIICGKDVKGHKPGQALLSLHKNGMDEVGRIIGAVGPYPFLTSSQEAIESFRIQITVHDLMGLEDIETVRATVLSLDQARP